jgi:hypothetical protein
MLVFASDVQLADGMSGTAIALRAFDKLCRNLSDIIQDPAKLNIRSGEITSIGDIFKFNSVEPAASIREPQF